MVTVTLKIDTKYGTTLLKYYVKLGPVIKWFKEPVPWQLFPVFSGTWFIHEHSSCKKQGE